ncbi:HPr-rel-A system PqqD family peptide chaperone [Sphingobium sp. AN558]|uniref:HPr-rel-A system PqqD family peptide chaperone n=1 Tax=Sphingobium sp. AN558 TaxID=3133442 RepID=UPI0030BDB4EF
MTAPIHYRHEGDVILTRVLDDIVLLFHRPSGQTHIVVSPVPELLDALREGGPATAADLLERLSRDFDLGPIDETGERIEAHLVELLALGLIRPS